MNTAPERQARDIGASLIEVLVAVVLIGATGIAVLGALTSSARGASLNESQAASIVWLQSSADYLSHGEYEACTAGTEAAVAAVYRTRLRDPEAPASPLGWPQTQIDVTQVRFWNGSAFVATCNPTYHIQELTLRATQPRGSVSFSLVMVMGETDV